MSQHRQTRFSIALTLLLIFSSGAVGADMPPGFDEAQQQLATVKAPSARAKVHVAAARMALNCAAEAAEERVAGAHHLVDLAKAQLQAAQSGGSGPAVIAAEQGPFVVLVNEKLGLLFKVTDRVADLRAIYHVSNDHQFLRWMIGTRPMWRIGTMTADPYEWGKVLGSTVPAPMVKKIDRADDAITLSLTWQHARPAMNVTVTCKLVSGADLSDWSIHLDNNDKKIGVAEVAFPLVRGIGKTEKQTHDFLAYPTKMGWLYVDPGKNANMTVYPRMQYMSYHTDDGAGLYLSTQDPTGNSKRVEALADSGTTATAFIYMTGNAGTPGVDYIFPGAIGVFNGDWYDGAMVYRRWALNQKWCPKYPLHDEHSTVPDWLKRCAVTFRSSMENMEKAHEQLGWVRRMQEFYGVPAMFHNYQWHTTPFGGSPETACSTVPEVTRHTIPGIAEVFKQVRELGMHTTSYSLIKIWDTRLDSWETEGKAAAHHDMDQDIIRASYEQLPLALACYGHKPYRDKLIAELARYPQYNLDGTYADLSGTNIGEWCFNKNHDHAPGAGTLMVDSQRDLLSGMRNAARKTNPDFVTLAETPDESIFDVIDAFLTFQGFMPGENRNIPMVMAVYGDFIRSYGCKSAGQRPAPKELVEIAMNWTYGSVMGRIFTPRSEGELQGTLTSHSSEYRRKLARLRHAAIDHIGMGRMRRPLAIRYDKAYTHEVPEMDYAVETNTWEAKDKTVAFLLANTRLAKEVVTVTYTIDPAEYNIPVDGSWALYQMDEEGKYTLRDQITGKLTYTDAMSQLDAFVYIAKPKH